MNTGLGKVIKKQLQIEGKDNCLESQDNERCNYDRFVFTNCKNVDPIEIWIGTNPRSPDWQIGFFDTDDEVYFDYIKIGSSAKFSSIVRNYWCNGKKGEQKKEGYYSLINSVKQLKVYNKQFINDLIDYAEGKYQTGKHWQLYELNRNIELKIYLQLKENVVERLVKHFDSVFFQRITNNLKQQNNVIYHCDEYRFTNCSRVIPQKLMINNAVESINFCNVADEVYFSEIVMEENADLKSIICNGIIKSKWEYYIIISCVQALIIRNNPKVLYDLADYITEKYNINNELLHYNRQFHRLNKSMKIVIEKTKIAFGSIKQITDYFTNALIDNQQFQNYECKYNEEFQDNLSRYDLQTDQSGHFILVNDSFELKDQTLNIICSDRKIHLMIVKQKITPQQVICFHNYYKPAIIGKVIIEDDGDLRCLLQNAYYNGVDIHFFNLLQIINELEIKISTNNGYQIIKVLADYIEAKYVLDENWKQIEFNKYMEIKIRNKNYNLSLDIVQRLRKHFQKVSVNHVQAQLQDQNIINLKCEEYYMFMDSRKIIPQKLILNGQLIGNGTLILFNDADDKVYIPEITIDKYGNFDAIVRNAWQNNKNGSDKKYGNYNLVQHVKTLIFRNNPNALNDFADYVAGIYKIGDGDYNLQQISRNIKIIIEDPKDAFSSISKIQSYFKEVTVDKKQPDKYLGIWKQWSKPDYKAFRNGFGAHGLFIEPPTSFVDATSNLTLQNHQNIRRSANGINSLTIRQKLDINQFVCFYDIDKAIMVNKIVIQENGDLRNVLQNIHYNNGKIGFFSLFNNTKKLEIYDNEQAVKDLIKYINGKYILHPQWERQALDKNVEIKIHYSKYSLYLDIAKRLRNYFRSVSIDTIKAPLQTENIIDQECKNHVFSNSRDASPQKLVINTKLMGKEELILFNDANGEVHTPEIIIDEQGCFAAIVRNRWQNNKEGNEYKSGYYSLVQHVQTLTIRNNPGVLKDLADYVVGKYEIGYSSWKLQQLNNNIKIVIERPENTFLHILRTSKYFKFVTIDGKQPDDYIQIIEQEELKNLDYKAFKACFDVYRLLVYPFLCSIKIQNKTELMDCVYNIRKAVASINLLTVRQKLYINQFVCFHDIDKAVTVDKIVIHKVGDLRSVLQNAYYKKGKGGFFSLLKTAKNLDICNNEQAVEDLLDYVDGKYTLHPKWGIQALGKDMVIKIHHDRYAFSLNVARKFKNYFKNISISCIWTQLETENTIDYECENKYVFVNCRNANPQKLFVNAKLMGNNDLILFTYADGEVCIPEITIGEHGSFDAIVRNHWQNCKIGSREKHGNYSLVSYVETLNIQNNPEAIHGLSNYVSQNYKIQQSYWKIQKLSKNITVRINGVNGLDEEINMLKDYFGYIVIDDRKILGNERREAIANIKLDSNQIQWQNTVNANRRNAVIQVNVEIAEAKQRVERARAKLRRRRARFREYLALAE